MQIIFCKGTLTDRLHGNTTVLGDLMKSAARFLILSFEQTRIPAEDHAILSSSGKLGDSQEIEESPDLKWTIVYTQNRLVLYSEVQIKAVHRVPYWQHDFPYYRI